MEPSWELRQLLCFDDNCPLSHFRGQNGQNAKLVILWAPFSPLKGYEMAQTDWLASKTLSHSVPGCVTLISCASAHWGTFTALREPPKGASMTFGVPEMDILAVFSSWVLWYVLKQCCMSRAFRCDALDTPHDHIPLKKYFNWKNGPILAQNGLLGPIGGARGSEKGCRHPSNLPTLVF